MNAPGGGGTAAGLDRSIPSPWLRALDLIGVAVFAASGTLAALAASLDLFGILVIAAVTAIGGGTLRDVLLGRHPVFWTRDSAPLAVIAAAALATLAWTRAWPVPAHALAIADALGLALFAITGAQVAEARACPAVVVVLMGTLSGAGGGVVRDLLTGRVPLLLRADIYASAAIAGVAAYLASRAAGVPKRWAMGLGLVGVAGIRLAALRFGWQLPVPRG